MFEMIACNLATLTIAMLYYAWRDNPARRQQPADLHERVAYMLWVSAKEYRA